MELLAQGRWHDKDREGGWHAIPSGLDVSYYGEHQPGQYVYRFSQVRGHDS